MNINELRVIYQSKQPLLKDLIGQIESKVKQSAEAGFLHYKWDGFYYRTPNRVEVSPKLARRVSRHFLTEGYSVKMVDGDMCISGWGEE